MRPGRSAVAAVFVLAAAACGGGGPPMDDSLSWSRLDSSALSQPGDRGGSVMRDVVAGGPGLVAVGTAGGDGIDAAIWTSIDGSVWDRVVDEADSLGGEGDQWIFAVAGGGPGLVAVGSVRIDDFDAAIWTSIDGTSWTRVSDTEGVLGGAGGQEFNDVVAGGPGLVAVGSDRSRPAVWTSVDGVSWSRAGAGSAAFAEAGLVSGIAVGGPGLVAVGSSGSFLATDAAVWTSADGLAWERVDGNQEAFEHGNMSDIVAGGPGLVAVGNRSPDILEQDAAVWTSADGASWTRISRQGSLFGGSGFENIWSVAAGSLGLVAVGSSDSVDSSGAETPDAAIWISPDGTTWLRAAADDETLGGDGPQVSWGVTAWETGFVAVGQGESTPPVVWLGKPGSS